MDSELQAIRDARLAQLKNAGGAGVGAGNNDNGSNKTGGQQIGSALAPFLEASALERLSRVSLVKPDRAMAVEQYLKQLISTGQVSHKINEEEIVQILNGIAREQNKQRETKIIFDRKDKGMMQDVSNKDNDLDSEDDFFDE